jgi:hypothetical protein
MSAVDGNAIAGQLAELFGADLTTAAATCASCGTAAPIAEYLVYAHGPGTVVRCHSCGAVAAVLVTVREITCVHLDGLRDAAWP